MTLTGILRRLGPIGRRMAWDREFRGTPGFVGDRAPTMKLMCSQYGYNGHIVELGCGDGSLAIRLRFLHKSYVGYDISRKAIESAEIRARRQLTIPHHTFHVGSLEAWRPDGPFDLLIIEEAIYYAKPAAQRAILKRAFAAGAKVLLTAHDGVKHAKTLANCKSVSRVIEEHIEGRRVYLVLNAPA